jgi:hypothetical protein
MKLVALMLAGSMLAGAASPQQPQVKPPSQKSGQRKAKPKSPSAFSTVPFDSSVERLPPNYQGHSMVDIWTELNKRRPQLKQDEYETKEAWAARLQKLQDQPLTGSLTVLSQFAFRAQDFKDEYDADTKTIQLSVNLGSVDFDEISAGAVPNHESILWWRDIRDAGSFVGSNAFGIKRRVRVEEKQAYFMLCKEGLIRSSGILKIEEVSIEQAKLIRPQIRVLIVGKLRRPYVGLDTRHKKATLDNPVETYSYRASCRMERAGCPRRWGN